MWNIFLVVLVSFFFSSCTEKKDLKSSSKETSICIYKGHASALFYIAQNQGLFKSNNLNINIIEHATGRDAFKGMLNNKCDYSNATEYVAIKNYFTNDSFKILASVSQANINGMVTKKSSNIKNGDDLKGRTVGTTIGTATEFYTGVFLEQYDLKLSDVKLVNVNPKERIDYIAKDKVDALFAWEPYIYNIINKYDVDYYPMPFGFEFDFVLAVNKDFNKDIATKILNSLIEASNIYNNSENKINIFKNNFNYDEKYFEYMKDKYTFNIILPYRLKVNMNKQRDFLRENKLVKNREFDTDDIFEKSILNSIDYKKVSIW